MPWSYDEACGSAVEILRAVGFSVERRTRAASAPCRTAARAAAGRSSWRRSSRRREESYIEWAGEGPGGLYRYELDGVKMCVFQGGVVWREAD